MLFHMSLVCELNIKLGVMGTNINGIVLRCVPLYFMSEVPERISTIFEAHANFIGRISSIAGLVSHRSLRRKFVLI
jgi:hypothetical protein